MSFRFRHCVECPKCRTRYLLGFSPYRNGSQLVPLDGFQEEWTLYCSCAGPPIRSQWRWNELEIYVVSGRAYDRGYGTPDEIAKQKSWARREPTARPTRFQPDAKPS